MDNNKYGKWTKKLDEMHLTLNGGMSGRTLCGRPMLGNNYAEYVPERELCEECKKKVK